MAGRVHFFLYLGRSWRDIYATALYSLRRTKRAACLRNAKLSASSLSSRAREDVMQPQITQRVVARVRFSALFFCLG